MLADLSPISKPSISPSGTSSTNSAATTQNSTERSKSGTKHLPCSIQKQIILGKMRLERYQKLSFNMFALRDFYKPNKFHQKKWCERNQKKDQRLMRFHEHETISEANQQAWRNQPCINNDLIWMPRSYTTGWKVFPALKPLAHGGTVLDETHQTNITTMTKHQDKECQI